MASRLQVKIRRVKETYFSDFPQKRKFGGDTFSLHATKKKKVDAKNLAYKLRKKGHYTRITHNKTLGHYLIWRG